MDLEKAVNREVLWQGLRMYGVGGKLLIGFKSMYVDSLTCVKVKWGEREWFSNVIQGCILSSWLSTVYVDVVIKEVKMGIGRRRVRFQKDGREWRLPGLLHADDLVLCGELEENLRAIVDRLLRCVGDEV